MRIAVVSDVFTPRLGGIEVQVGELARRLVAAGHHVEVFTVTPAGNSTSDEGEPFPVRRLPGPLRLPRGLVYSPVAPRGLASALATGRFDVMHVHLGVLAPFAAAAVRLAQRHGLPVVVTWHSLIEPASARWLRRLGAIDRWAERGAVLTACSAVTAHRVQAAMRDRHPVEVLPNGLDMADWWAGHPDAPPPAEHLPDRFGLRVVGAMRLAPLKRPVAFLEIIEKARRLAPEVPIMADLVGDGPLRGRAHTWIRARRAHWAHLTGRLDRTDLRRVLTGADVYLCTAHREAFGIAALEARATGLPVLAMQDTGPQEFITDGLNGLLVPDDDAMAHALADLARDPARLAAMRRHNITEEPARFSWPGVVAAAEEMYRQAGARG